MAEEEKKISDVERDKSIKTLSNTLTNLYESDLKVLSGKVKDFSDRQDRLNKEIQVEKEFFAKDENWKDANDFIIKIQIYKEKLQAIKKEMSNIHNRTKTLKRKATDIQEYKIKQQNQQK